ncbi:MAG: TRAP transporter small permease [Pseudomonadota bacterium]
MHAIVERLARLFALLGGLVLSALIVLTCLSIVGRSLNTVLHGDLMQGALPGLANALLELGVGPINGDFELVEAGMAFAICAFLPLCHLHGAHASVDVFTSALPPRTNRALGVVIEIVFVGVVVLIAWQLFLGMESKRNSGQTTLLLQFPVWWAYAVSVTGAAVAALVSIYVAAMRTLEAVTGRQILPERMGADG